jgi:purine-binding chemotaxis protein CheW
MSGSTNLLVFVIEDTRLAVDLEQVDRVVRAATLKAIPGAPPSVLGLLNLNGIPVPVISLRRKLKLEERELDTTDEIIILKRQKALLGLVVDDVESVTQVKEIPRLADAAQLTHLTGALKLQDNIVLVHDIDMFLTSQEEFDLASALYRSVLE